VVIAVSTGEVNIYLLVLYRPLVLCLASSRIDTNEHQPLRRQNDHGLHRSHGCLDRMNRIFRIEENGISEIEGKAARVAASEAGAERVSNHGCHGCLENYEIRMSNVEKITESVSWCFACTHESC